MIPGFLSGAKRSSSVHSISLAESLGSALGPPVERLEEGDPFFCSLF